MAYSLTSAASPKALLAAIVTFATAQGWTIEYDNAAGTTGTVGGQIALTSGNCHVAIGEATSTENPIAVTGDGGSFSDGRIYAALSSSITVASKQFWGHPDSLVASATSGNRVKINDVYGPMEEVHFFGDDTYILCAVKSSAERWTTFGFGNLDNQGMSIPSCGFVFGEYWEFWSTSTLSGVPHNVDLLWNEFPVFNNSQIRPLQLFLPADVMDTSYGFDDSARVLQWSNSDNDDLYVWAFSYLNRTTQNSGIQDNSTGSGFLDHLMWCANQANTGGVALMSMPMFLRDTTLNLHTYVGDIPGFRLCLMAAIVPGDEETYGGDTYKIVPLKRKGTRKDAGFDGGTYDKKPNSYNLGYAIKKVD